MLPLTLNVSNYLGIVELTIPLALTPLFYRFRHSLKIERRRVLLYLTMALGVVVMPMGLTKVQLFIPVVIGFIFTVILLLTLYLVHDLVSPILIAQSTSYLFTVSSIIGSIMSMFMGYVIQYLGILGWIITGILIMTSSLIYRILKITL
ncbi:hypothetical protein [Vulcanisaeta sp. JCM 16159]|uniref:hypothetical protein n=1 Tax=Vulcanisaeta sp. JCM 16159 TaxID=1295371 RepID=UPI0006D241A0|nr:hypothetical protein [Vulcanisaeta sp. JCM 16159]